MVERVKDAIVQLLKVSRDITEGEAEDIVKETQYVINDTLAGETDYSSPDAVIEDYLGLTADYTWLFLLDDSKPVTEIPLFTGTVERLNKLTIHKNDHKG